MYTDALGGDVLCPASSIEIDRVDRSGWYAILDGFDDANIFQTWDYGRIAHAGRELSHLVVRRDGRPVAAVQVLLRRVPGIGGLALVMWGPMWHPRGQGPDHAALMTALHALKAEYTDRRGLMLRLLPHVSQADGEAVTAALASLGMRFREEKAPYRTFITDLNADEAGLRSNLSHHWRRGLNKAERMGIEVVEGSHAELLETIDDIFVETQRRKGFKAYDSRTFTRINEALPPRRKMRAFLAMHEGRPVAGVVVSLFGTTGQMQNSATLEAGLRVNAAYLLQWRALLWIKANGGLRYDLHGVNAQTNPGVYQFKRGLAGKHPVETLHIGTFETPGPLPSRLLVQGGESMRVQADRWKTQAGALVGRLRNWKPPQAEPAPAEEMDASDAAVLAKAPTGPA
ncbi:hypothetical protein [Azospirillum argentinense]|uniref:lipid II:glycine glycyltransferase FemX n=1 Tax=Azospirillum argentinense TaxID=2970906 RepID=UPI0032DF77C6